MAFGSPLDIATARLRWADGHIARLRSIVDGYAATALHVSEEVDWEREVIKHTATAVGDPPLDISLCLGDALQQLRATLDTAVGGLRDGGPTGNSAFPIQTDPEKWPASAARRLEGLPEWAKEAIRRIQPFADDAWSAIGDGLVVLHELAIRDRHHALLVAKAIAELGHVEVDVETGGRLYRPGAALQSFVTEYPLATHPRPQFHIDVYLVESIGSRPQVRTVVDAAESARWAVATTLWWLEEERGSAARVSRS